MVLSQFHSQSATRQIKQVSYHTLVTSLFRCQTSWRFCKPGVLQSSHREKAKMEVVMCYLCLTTGIKTQSVQFHRLQKWLSERDVLYVWRSCSQWNFSHSLCRPERKCCLSTLFSKVSEGKWPQKNEKQNKDDNSSRAMQRKPLQMTSTRAICVDIQLILPSTIIGRKSRSEAGVWEISWWFICCCFCSAGRHSSYFRVALNISLQAPPAG